MESFTPPSSFSTLSSWNDESQINSHPYDFMSTDWDSLPLTSNYWRSTDEELFGHRGSDGDDDVSMQNIADQLIPPPSTSRLSHLSTDDQDIEFVPAKGKGKQKAVVEAHDEDTAPSYVFGPKGISSKAKGKQRAVPKHTTAISPNILTEHALSQYTCPICFCPPTNATMTLCGHVACGSCLFTAVKTAMRRENMMGAASREDGGPRCPVCRAPIIGWDGKGGGVIGLVMQTVTVAG